MTKKNSQIKFCFPYISSLSYQIFKVLMSTPHNTPLIMGDRHKNFEDPITQTRDIRETNLIREVFFSHPLVAISGDILTCICCVVIIVIIRYICRPSHYSLLLRHFYHCCMFSLLSLILYQQLLIGWYPPEHIQVMHTKLFHVKYRLEWINHFTL